MNINIETIQEIENYILNKLSDTANKSKYSLIELSNIHVRTDLIGKEQAITPINVEISRPTVSFGLRHNVDKINKSVENDKLYDAVKKEIDKINGKRLLIMHLEEGVTAQKYFELAREYDLPVMILLTNNVTPKEKSEDDYYEALRKFNVKKLANLQELEMTVNKVIQKDNKKSTFSK